MKSRLSVLYFLQFSVWGCYLTSFGQFLGASGLGRDIAWFYAAIGLVSIFTPPLLGRLADLTGRPEKLLASCHFLAGVVMLSMWSYGHHSQALEFRTLYPLYLLFLALYMPTMALANTLTFGILKNRGLETVTIFPKIRIWGTIGFISAMWFVNSAFWSNGSLGFTFNDNTNEGLIRFQYNAMQLMCAGIMGIITSLYTLSLPSIKSYKKESISSNTDKPSSLVYTFGRLVSNQNVSVFLIFVILSGVCLQISNGFATPFITHFTGMPEYSGSWASGNATILFSLSQLSEACCILLVGVALNRWGIRMVFATGLLAWALRFFLFATGNPGNGLWALVCSMIVYGIAFNFITIGGHIHIQQVAPSGMKGFAQGLMMFMSNGIGATVGTLVAGNIVNRWCTWEDVILPSSDLSARLFMGDWDKPWFIFSIYALMVLTLWLICYRTSYRESKTP